MGVICGLGKVGSSVGMGVKEGVGDKVAEGVGDKERVGVGVGVGPGPVQAARTRLPSSRVYRVNNKVRLEVMVMPVLKDSTAL